MAGHPATVLAHRACLWEGCGALGVQKAGQCQSWKRLLALSGQRPSRIRNSGKAPASCPPSLGGNQTSIPRPPQRQNIRPGDCMLTENLWRRKPAPCESRRHCSLPVRSHVIISGQSYSFIALMIHTDSEGKKETAQREWLQHRPLRHTSKKGRDLYDFEFEVSLAFKNIFPGYCPLFPSLGVEMEII